MTPIQVVNDIHQQDVTRQRDRNESLTVLRACEVLKAFQSPGEELSLAEVMKRAHLPKTTTFRLLRTLTHGGLIERTSSIGYRNRVGGLHQRARRIGLSLAGDDSFSNAIKQSIELAAARHHVEVITVNNRNSAKEAVRSAEALVKENIDLCIGFQTYERIAPAVAEIFENASIPTIALEVPQPGAVYFGANNYKAGYLAGRSLGRWAQKYWNGNAERLLLIEIPAAGQMFELRMTGIWDGLKFELPNMPSNAVMRVNGRGDIEQSLDSIRRYLRRAPMRRTLIGAATDACALAAVHAFQEQDALKYCAAIGHNAVIEARQELRRPNSRLIGSIAYFPEQYGDQLLPLALSMMDKKTISPAITLKHQLITAKNVDLFYPLDPVLEHRHAESGAGAISLPAPTTLDQQEDSGEWAAAAISSAGLFSSSV